MATTVTGRVSAVPQSNLHQQDLTKLDVTKLSALSPEVISRQATINIGTIGHVAHGKSTVVKAVSGVQTVRFKNELERNITIKLERLSDNTLLKYIRRGKKRKRGHFMDKQEPKKKKSREAYRQKNGEYIIENITDQRIFNGVQCFLIKWKDWSHYYNTWEPVEHLENCSKILSEFLNTQYEHNSSHLENLKEELSFGDLVKPDILENLFKTDGSIQFDDADRDLKMHLLGLYTLSQTEEHHADLLVINARTSIQKYELARLRKMQLTILKEWEDLLNTVDRAGMLQVENEYDLSLPPEKFDYINKSVPGEGVVIPDDPPIWCKCNPCNSKSKCGCGSQGGHFAYFSNKRLRVTMGTPIYECNKLCTCKEDCNNRVVQNGRKLKLCIFRTHTGCGWGVRSVHRIKMGQFVCQYVGEVITSEEAEKRGQTYDQNGLTYLFDLDFNAADIAYTIDAAHTGNVSHFINHSCDPNLGVWAVWSDCLDPNLPMLALFATKDIEPGEEICFDYDKNTGNELAELDNNKNEEDGLILDGRDTSMFNSPIKENKQLTSPIKLRSPMKMGLNNDHPEILLKQICKCNSTKCRGYLFFK